MSEPWPLVPLSGIARPIERPVEVEPGVRYRTIGVKWWGEGAYERQTIDGSETAARSLSIVRENDLIINKIWVRHGSTAVATSAVDGCAASGEFPTFVLDEGQVFPRWLHWLTKTPWFWDKCDRLSQGTSGKNRIRPERFLTIEIPLPPPAEQRRIVARVEAIAGRIAEAKGLREDAVAQTSAIVSSIHLSLSGERTLLLGDFLVLDEKRVEVRMGDNYPQVGVKGFGEGLFAKEAVQASQTTYKTFNRLFEGAVVLSQVKGWEGAVAVCPPGLAGRFASPEYRTFRCIPEEVMPDYLAALVPTPWFWTQLGSLTRGVGARRERIRPEQFLTIRVPMPSVSKQRDALQIFRPLRLLPHLQAQTAAELDALLPAVLAQAFAGQL